jgi:membrane-associated phospholipid phosphatase
MIVRQKKSSENRQFRSISLLAVFLYSAIFSASLSAGTDPDNLDVKTFRAINNWQGNTATGIVKFVDNTVWPMAAGVPAGMILYGIVQKDDDVLKGGITVGAAECLAFGIRYVLKVGIKRERPYEALDNVHVNHLESADPYSFPSGHTTGAMAIATTLSFLYPKPSVYIPAFAWAGMVGYGRVYLGLHYPTDILGGAVIGAGCALVTFHYQSELMGLFSSITGKRFGNNASLVLIPERGGVRGVFVIAL